MKKRYVCLIGIICGLLMLSYIVPIPFSKTVDALKVDIEKNCILEEHIIMFNGYYHIKLLKNDVFSGEMIISGYEHLLTDFSLTDVNISKEGRSLDYRYIGDLATNRKILSLGHIYSSSFLDRCMIVLFDEQGNLTSGGSYSSKDAICIVVGVSTYEEAKTIIESYLLVP